MRGRDTCTIGFDNASDNAAAGNLGESRSVLSSTYVITFIHVCYRNTLLNFNAAHLLIYPHLPCLAPTDIPRAWKNLSLNEPPQYKRVLGRQLANFTDARRDVVVTQSKSREHERRQKFLSGHHTVASSSSIFRRCSPGGRAPPIRTVRRLYGKGRMSRTSK